MLNNISQAGILELAKRRAERLAQDRQAFRYTDDPIRWITTNFYVPELKGPLQLMPYHQAVLRKALTKGPDGQFPYSTIVWSDVKKSIKSTIAAAIGLWRAYTTEWGSVIVVANDLKQADSRVGFYMRRAVELNPAMKAITRIRNYSIKLPNNAAIESVSIDPTGEAGSNADMVIFSELWGAHQEAQQRMWTEMTLPPNKFGQSFRWVETYAGYTGESPLLEQLYKAGVKEGTPVDVGIPDLPLYENKAARLLVLWNTTPRCPWQSPEYYAQEAAVLTDDEFQRIHRNKWVSSSSTFVPIQWWDRSRKDLPSLKENQPLVFALDAAVSGDTFGILGLSRHGKNLAVRCVRKYVPPKGGKLDYGPIEADIRLLAKQYNVLEWAYDEFQLHDMATRLMRDGIGWFKAFPQGQQRLVADKQLYDLIRDDRVHHSGESDLREHIENSNAQVDGDNKLRLVKKADDRKIDLAVCLSMAAYEALRLNIE